MIIQFEATEFGMLEESDMISCGASNYESDLENHYFFIQRFLEKDEVDEGEIYFEIDDRINSGYELITSCILNKNLLEIRLKKGFKWYPDLNKVIVILPTNTEEILEFAYGLKLMFYNHKEILKVTA